jgi:hypothetical protein
MAWTLVALPNSGFATGNYLHDVTCVSGSDCWAAGQYFDSIYPGGYKTLLEHWDGASWTIVGSLNGDPSQFTDSYLNGVTCSSSSDCWAAGYSQDMVHGGYGALVEHWDGKSWSIVATSTTGPPVLQHVTCASASDCWIVGYSGTNTLAEHWDGNSWSIVSSPNGDPTRFNALYGVTCVAGNDCWAAGMYDNYQGSVYQTLMEHWNGSSWMIVPSANPNTTLANIEPNQLQGVTCVSEANCWAVGYSQGSTYQTLVEHWDGKEWTIVSSPNTTSWSNQLNGVTCTSASDCWAVGYIQGGSQTLIEHWDGTTWNIIASSNTNTSTNILYTVSCATASQCWAIGFSGSPATALIERWDGTSWTIVPSLAPPSASSSFLTGVICTSASDCWAVGYYQDSLNKNYRTLIERWNGASWVIVTSPNPGTQNYLSGVSCTSASDCWAVGDYAGGSTYEMLFEHWNGSAWSVVPRTSSSSLDEFLSNVTCVSPTECWAVGYHNVRNSTRHPLIANWDGVAWAVTPAADTGAEEKLLSGVASSSDSQSWAVGYSNPVYPAQTLVEQYSLPTVPSYTISVNPGLAYEGVADGGGRYLSGSDVTVTALANSGYTFANWTENGSIVSTSTNYESSATSARTLIANFVAYPTVSLAVSPVKIGKNGTATFTVSGTTTNPSQPLVVGYSIGGTAAPGSDYTLSGSANQITIPAGQSFGSITLTAITAKTKKQEKATLTLTSGQGYNLSVISKKRKTNPNQATVTIVNK